MIVVEWDPECELFEGGEFIFLLRISGRMDQKVSMGLTRAELYNCGVSLAVQLAYKKLGFCLM